VVAEVPYRWSGNSEDVMRVELETDKNASRALRMPIMDFRVHLALGERPTPELHSRVAVLEWSAAGAWDIVHDSDWKGRSQ
jgi:hypothetical protein